MKQITWEHNVLTTPKSISEMSLYPSLKESLMNWEKTNTLKNVILSGSYGTGKTTCARIFANMIDAEYVEHDCVRSGGKSDMIELTNNMMKPNLMSLMSGKSSNARVLILDEFHDVKPDGQSVLKKWMEDKHDKVKVILCVNNYQKVSGAIADRCVYFDFDVFPEQGDGTGVYKLQKETGYNHIKEWYAELELTADHIEKKLNIKLSKKIRESVLKNPKNVSSVRSYVRSLQSAYELTN